MYNETQILNEPKKTNPHLEMAEAMASQIIEIYDPKDQNEVLKFIHEKVRSNRQEVVKRLEEDLKYLVESLSAI
jgi:hypothetical protein